MNPSTVIRRCMAIILLFFLVIPALSFLAYAHTGRTDSNGGHIDSSTGDYHYHHGYPAHAHFDIDGDGVIDCPYNFVDQTNHASGTDSSSYSDGYSDGSEDGYSEGYADGYKKGKADGQEDGYLNGERAAQSEYEKQLSQAEEEYKEKINSLKTSFSWISFLIITFLFFVFGFYVSRRKKRWNEAYRKRAEVLVSTHASQIKKIKASYESQVKQLNLQIKNLKRFTLLDKIASGEDTSILLPNDIHLKQSYAPIKGSISKNYPFGEYTVFMTPTGKKYHCKFECVTSANPLHFFDLPKDAEPCWKCVPKDMRPQPLPEWYIQIRKKLDSEYERRLSCNQLSVDFIPVSKKAAPSKQSSETSYLMEAANGMLVSVPESKLEAWQKAQEGQGPKPTEAQKRMIKDKIIQEIYGSKPESK